MVIFYITHPRISFSDFLLTVHSFFYFLFFCFGLSHVERAAEGQVKQHKPLISGTHQIALTLLSKYEMALKNKYVGKKTASASQAEIGECH